MESRRSADVTSWDAVCDLVNQHGPVDVLVNNAGVPIVGADPPRSRQPNRRNGIRG